MFVLVLISLIFVRITYCNKLLSFLLFTYIIKTLILLPIIFAGVREEARRGAGRGSEEPAEAGETAETRAHWTGSCC